MDQTAATPPRARKGPTTAHVLVLVLLLVIVVLLPFTVGSVFVDISEQSTPVYRVHRADEPPGGAHADAHLQVIGINEWQGSASIRVSMHRFCDPTCDWTDRVLFVSAFGDSEDLDRGRPATEAVTLAAASRDVVSTIQLPLFGDPIRYPYDKYQLAVGVILERVNPDGTATPIAPEDARQYLSITLQGRMPRATMERPEQLDPSAAQTDPQDVRRFMAVELLRFERPFYLKVLTVLLVLLVTAAAAYAVFLRPLDQLIINSGALVLGVWGVRSILLGTDVNGITAVDLSLATVILFLLMTITVRTAYLLEDSSSVRVFKRRSPSPGPDAPAPSAEPQKPDYVPGVAGVATEGADGVSERGAPSQARR